MIKKKGHNAFKNLRVVFDHKNFLPLFMHLDFPLHGFWLREFTVMFLDNGGNLPGQFIHAEGFGQKTVRVQILEQLFHVAAARHDQHGVLGFQILAANMGIKINTPGFGHVDVQKNKVGIDLLGFAQAVLAVKSGHDFIPLGDEKFRKHFDQGPLIVNDQKCPFIRIRPH